MSYLYKESYLTVIASRNTEIRTVAKSLSKDFNLNSMYYYKGYYAKYASF